MFQSLQYLHNLGKYSLNTVSFIRVPDRALCTAQAGLSACERTGRPASP